MKKSKKIISLLLSILMIITSIPLMAVNSFAEDTNTKTSGYYEYTVLEDGTAEITKYTGSTTELSIPSEIDGYSVTSIGDVAFGSCTALTSITIPDSVTSIGSNAFYYCTSLTSITIPDSVTSIGDYAFSYCRSLTSITIPDSVTSIGNSVFSHCTSLTSITIPDSVTSIGSNAFYYCTSLSEISVNSENANYSSENGMLFNKDKTKLICYPAGKKDLSYSIPDSVTSIGEGAFYDCRSLTSIIIPDSVISIGYQAFDWCTALTNITIGKGVTSIENGEDYAFNLPTSIGEAAFRGCTSLDNINVVDENANYSSEDGVLFDKDKTELIKYPVGRKDASYTIPDSVTSLDDEAFWYCISLTSIVIPNSVTSIGDGAFEGCTSLISVTIGNSVTNIGHQAFCLCSSLASIFIPDSVTSIGYEAFVACDALANITISDSVMRIYENAFADTAYYDNEFNWDNGILYIGNYLIKAKSDISGSVEIRQGTKVIADDAFLIYDDVEALKSVTIPDSVMSIGAYAFGFCASLTNVTLGNGVTNINDRAFYDCTSLTNITIPDSVTSIGEWTFYNCNALKSITIPANVEKISDYAFGYYYNETDYEAVTISGFTICGVAGSEAERYAKDNEFTFVTIGGAPTVTFPDVASGEWYYNAIKFNVDKGYFHGYGNGNFGPADNIQRQDFVVVLAKIANADLSAYEGQNGGFSDVPTNDYYSAAVAWAKDNHILSGYANGKFGVGDPITREQACVIFFNYITGYCDKGVGSSNTPEEICSRYPDGGNVSDWARTAVAWAAQNNVVGGNGKLNPAGNANRAEMAQIIMNMSNNDIL